MSSFFESHPAVAGRGRGGSKASRGSRGASTATAPSANTSSSDAEDKAAKRKRNRHNIIHEKLVLEINPDEQTVVGFAELVIVPLHDKVKYLAINCKNLTILSVFVDDFPANHYAYAPPTAQYHEGGAAMDDTVGLERVRDLRNWEMYYHERLDMSEYGEMLVEIPKHHKKQKKNQPQPEKEGGDDESVNIDITTLEDNLNAPIVVRIAYRCPIPAAGLHFCVPHATLFPNRPTQVSSCTWLGDPAVWFPCFDGIHDRYTFECEFTVPKNYVVVSTGRLVGQYLVDAFSGSSSTSSVPATAAFATSAALSTSTSTSTSTSLPNASPSLATTSSLVTATAPSSTSTSTSTSTSSSGGGRTFVYRVDVPIMARSLGLAIAPFHICTPLSDDQQLVTQFCIEENRDMMAYTAEQATPAIIKMYESYLGFPFPYDSYKQVFVDEAYESCQSYAGLGIFSSSLLYDRTIIDQAFETQELLAWGCAWSWIGTAVVLESYADTWLLQGICGFLTMMYMEKVFGHNEARYRRRMDTLFVCDSEDVMHGDKLNDGKDDDDTHAYGYGYGYEHGTAPISTQGQGQSFRAFHSRPLYWNGYAHPSELFDDVAKKKSAIVMKMLEQRIGKHHFRTLINQVLRDSCDSKDVGDEPRVPLSTKRFLEFARELSHDLELKQFFDQWIYCDGSAKLRVDFRFNKKKHQTDLTVTQEQLQKTGTDIIAYNQNITGIQQGLGLHFTGALLFRIHEVERSTEQERRIEADKQLFEFACYSRLRRNRRRRQVSEADLGRAELLARKTDTPVLWIRADPYQQWMRPVKVEQDEVMWVQQLDGDNDMLSQLDAIAGLERWNVGDRAESGSAAAAASGSEQELDAPTKQYLSVRALRDALGNPHFYYRVRCRAATALAEASQYRAGTNNLAMIGDFFKSKYSDPSLKQNFWKANDFSDFPEYFVKKCIPVEVSRVVEHSTRLTPAELVKFILSLLHDNDNAGNPYSDTHYLAAIIQALGNIRLSHDESRAPLLTELDRYINLDQVLPSYHNLITQAAIKTLCRLWLSGQIDVSYLPLFRSCCEYGNFNGLRVTAFECLVQCSLQHQHIVPQLLHILETERVPGVRLSMAVCWSHVYGLSGSASTVTALESFRRATPLMSDLMNRLYTLLNSTWDERFRDALYRLYRTIWGRGTPNSATLQQFKDGQRLWSLYETVRAKQTEHSTHGRIHRARQDLRRLRGKRAAGSVHETGTIKFKKKGTTYKASESIEYNDHEDL